MHKKQTLFFLPTHNRISQKMYLIIKIALMALVSMSCSIGQLTGRIIESQVEEIVPTTQIEPTSSQPAAPGATPENVINPLGFQSGDALVWMNPDGQIIFQHPNGRLQTASLEVPKSPWWGLAYMAQQVTVTQNGVYFLAPSIDSNNLSLIVATPDGVTHPVPPPPMQGIFSGAFPSPDGEQIIWLEDISTDRPSMTRDPECDLDPNCTGWVFNIHISGPEGGEARQSIRFETGNKAIAYGLSLSAWRQDGEVVYLKGAVNLESAVYPSIAGELFAVDLSSGTVKQVPSHYEALAVSSDGRWNASITYDTQARLSVLRDDKLEIEINFPPGTFADQAVFSPQSDSLLFMQVEGKVDDWKEILSIKMMRIDLSNGQVSEMMSFVPPVYDGVRGFDLPYSGLWITDHLLVINTRDGSRILDTRSGDWLEDWTLPEGGPRALLGALPADLRASPGKMVLRPTTAVNTSGAPNGSLSSEGPWLLFTTDEGLWAANSDGSGRTLLVKEPIVSPADLQKAVSPDGRHVAYVTAADSYADQGLKLRLLSLPDGSVRTLTDLTGPSTTVQGDPEICSSTFEATRAVSLGNSLAWSPDGKQLAFIGAQDGPSADLYTYTFSNEKITRLTDGISQAFEPSWSPDSKYIVHFGATCFGTGAGFAMAGAWAARADDSAVISLFIPESESAGASVAGWSGTSTVAVQDWSPICGAKDLRKINIETGKTQVLLKGCSTDAVLTRDGALAALVDPETPLIDQPGLFIFPPNGNPIHIQNIPGSQMVYNHSGDLLMVTDYQGRKIDAYSTRGEFQLSLDPWDDFAVSPDGILLAAVGVKGLLITPDSEGNPRMVMDDPAKYPQWSPDGKGVLFFAGKDLYGGPLALYIFQPADFQVTLLQENLIPNRAPVWAIP